MKIKNRGQYFQLFRSKLSHKDLFKLDFAYDLTKYAHQYLGQMRESGERYFEHPREVSVLIATALEVFDIETHLVALLHDCPEDTHLLSYDRIRFLFGKNVANAVLAVTKKNPQKISKEIFMKKYFTSIKKAGWRACLIKCTDRIHNLRTLNTKTENGLKKAREQIIETNEYILDLLPVIIKHNKDLAVNVEGLLTKELRRLSKLI